MTLFLLFLGVNLGVYIHTFGQGRLIFLTFLPVKKVPAKNDKVWKWQTPADFPDNC